MPCDLPCRYISWHIPWSMSGFELRAFFVASWLNREIAKEVPLNLAHALGKRRRAIVSAIPSARARWPPQWKHRRGCERWGRLGPQATAHASPGCVRVSDLHRTVQPIPEISDRRARTAPLRDGAAAADRKSVV